MCVCVYYIYVFRLLSSTFSVSERKSWHPFCHYLVMTSENEMIRNKVFIFSDARRLYVTLLPLLTVC